MFCDGRWSNEIKLIGYIRISISCSFVIIPLGK
ncbi:hypothetical protein XFF6992_260008 [Xanthomonas citri pv. fuscans]|nr:hypothetical protein XFF6992_190008 [Xanthomonas citri pv. fuscans]SOO18700.1 hypothetical protein XFF6992_260008 [Xanthomonas citri pv. fuscans]